MQGEHQTLRLFDRRGHHVRFSASSGINRLRIMEWIRGQGNLATPIVVATGIAVALLGGCGGGSDGVASSGSQNAAVSGTVAGGNPVADATITDTGVNGKTATTQGGSNGAYTLNVAGLSQPIALVATDPSGQVSPLVMALAQLPASGRTAIANVTTLITALGRVVDARWQSDGFRHVRGAGRACQYGDRGKRVECNQHARYLPRQSAWCGRLACNLRSGGHGIHGRPHWSRRTRRFAARRLPGVIRMQRDGSRWR